MAPERGRWWQVRGWAGDRLAIRQVGYALSLAIVLGMAFNVVHLLHDYLQERRRIETVGRGVLQLVSPPAGLAALTGDAELAATVTRTLLEVPFVVRAVLSDDPAHPLASGLRPREAKPLRWLTDAIFGKHLTYRVSLDRGGRALPPGEATARAVGTLEIEFDTRVLAEDFLWRSWVLIVTGMARTVILGLVLAIVTHLLITRPLAKVVAAVEKVDPEAPTPLPIKFGRNHARDELGRLACALDALLARFAGALAQRREAFDRLAASETRYRSVVEAQSEFIARITPDDRLSFVSDSYCRYYGRTRAELLGQPMSKFTLTLPEDRERDVAHLASLAPERPTASIELRRRLPDGSVRWVQWTDTALFDQAGRLLEYQAVGRDVTERVEALTALRASEARFLAAAESIPDGLMILDRDDRIVFYNSRHQELVPASLRQELRRGVRFGDWIRAGLARGPVYHPDMGADYAERRLASRGNPPVEREHRHADGRWVHIRESRMPDGGRVLLTSDITQRRRLEGELRQAEKLKAVGTLASGIAHDFNNVLATIFASTEVALAQLPEGTPARATLGRVLTAGKRGRELVSQVLTFSRTERAPRLAIELGAAVEAVAELCRPTLGRRVELAVERPAEPLFVAADETQIHQLVSNLCLNAAQAMPNGGRVVLTLAVDERLEPPGRAILRVRDSGSGMDPATAARVFEPFFTTKPVGGGTGLGLAVVHGVVEALGGQIRLETKPNRGSVFSVSLPRVLRLDAAEVLPRATPLPAGAGRVVVQVEPDDAVAEAIGAMLRSTGYRVVRFVDPSDALEALTAATHRDGVLIAEMALPGLSGVELAEAARAQLPGLAVILLADGGGGEDEAEGVVAEVLRKPVLRRELSAALARLTPQPALS